MTRQTNLSVALAAVSDPTRRAILANLKQGDASVSELAEPFKLTVRAISKHIGVLEAAGLVTRIEDGRRRLSHLEIDRLKEIDRWLEQYRELWEGRFDNMEELLNREKAKETSK
jgi:DNA-binding transcriptional ArsR family regulator